MRIKMKHSSSGETMEFHASKEVEMLEKGWEKLDPPKKKAKPSKKQRVNHGRTNNT